MRSQGVIGEGPNRGIVLLGSGVVLRPVIVRPLGRRWSVAQRGRVPVGGTLPSVKLAKPPYPTSPCLMMMAGRFRGDSHLPLSPQNGASLVHLR